MKAVLMILIIYAVASKAAGSDANDTGHVTQDDEEHVDTEQGNVLFCFFSLGQGICREKRNQNVHKGFGNSIKFDRISEFDAQFILIYLDSLHFLFQSTLVT